jgi:hypothetical protein
LARSGWHRFWQILVSVSNVFWEFRSRFVGKSSPLHFFWGSFDLALKRPLPKAAATKAKTLTAPAGSAVHSGVLSFFVRSLEF